AGIIENAPGEIAPDDVKDEQAGDDDDLDGVELPPVDYSGYSKSELVETLGLIIENRPPSEIRDDVERIKIFFYKKLKLENEEKRKKFLESGGKIEDYKQGYDIQKNEVKHLREKYKEKRNDFIKIQEG